MRPFDFRHLLVDAATCSFCDMTLPGTLIAHIFFENGDGRDRDETSAIPFDFRHSHGASICLMQASCLEAQLICWYSLLLEVTRLSVTIRREPRDD
jgi:hypothetical protein